MAPKNKITFAFFSLFAMLYAVSLAAKELEDLKPGVVMIEFEGTRGRGSGFIVKISEDGVVCIVTASHVLNPPHIPQVTFFKQLVPVPAETRKREPDSDGRAKGLACILVRGQEDLIPKLRALSPRASISLEGGDKAYAIGHPQLSKVCWAITEVNVTGKDGQYPVVTGPIMRGNSGGPLIKDGKVVGMAIVNGEYKRIVPVANIQSFLDGQYIEWVADHALWRKVVSLSCDIGMPGIAVLGLVAWRYYECEIEDHEKTWPTVADREKYQEDLNRLKDRRENSIITMCVGVVGAALWFPILRAIVRPDLSVKDQVRTGTSLKLRPSPMGLTFQFSRAF